jgi:hypothetical protein
MITRPLDFIDPMDPEAAKADVLGIERLTIRGTFGTPVLDLDVAHRTTLDRDIWKAVYEKSKALNMLAMVTCIRKEKLN